MDNELLRDTLLADGRIDNCRLCGSKPEISGPNYYRIECGQEFGYCPRDDGGKSFDINESIELWKWAQDTDHRDDFEVITN